MRTKEYIFTETDDSCALCGQKELQNLTEHHIDENHKNNEYDNLIVLCHNCHCRFHQKKGIAKKDIESVKRRLIIKTLTHYGVNALKISKRNHYGVVATPFLLFHLVDLGLMMQKEVHMLYDKVDVTCRFDITQKGKDLCEKWFQ